MRFPGDPFAGFPEGVALPEGLETVSAENADSALLAAADTASPHANAQTSTARPPVEYRESVLNRQCPQVALAVMATLVIAWVGCMGHFAIAVFRSQRSISRAITSLEADGFQVTRAHVEVLVADGPGKLSAESARAMCRADFIRTYKIRQNSEPGPLPAEFAVVFEAVDIPPYREYTKRQNWQKLLSESP